MTSQWRPRAILVLDMSFTLEMYRERQLNQALESRKLGGYFSKVISVHPLAGLFEPGESRFGAPVLTQLDEGHLFISGTVGVSRLLNWLPPLNLILAQARLISLMYRLGRDSRVDVIRIGDPYYLGLLGLVLAKLLSVPLTIRACFDYDLLFKTSRKAVFPKLFRFRFVEKWIERFVFPRCDLVAGANQNNLDYAIANGALRERGIIFRYGNLIHPAHFTGPETRGDIEQIRDELQLHGSFMLTICRLEKMKQPEQNLYALRELRRAGHDIGFVFIGDGALLNQLEQMAKEMGLSDAVIFAGNRPQEWIAAILPHAKVVLSPHMGRALTEACLAGVPIVAYDYDWQGEIIRGEETGELVPDGDWSQRANKAQRLLEDRSYAIGLGSAARRLALDMMSPGNLSQHEIQAYENLFRSRR